MLGGGRGAVLVLAGVLKELFIGGFFISFLFFLSSVRMNSTLQIKYHTSHRISVVIPSTAFSKDQNLSVPLQG